MYGSYIPFKPFTLPNFHVHIVHFGDVRANVFIIFFDVHVINTSK